jgi:catechol 2,3-dioxygenase-like lactoylglutathione lyase family enzyme
LKISASAVSLNVDDVEASASFLQRHFGFEEAMATEGFASLSREDAGFNIVFLRAGLPTSKPARLQGHSADGAVGRTFLPARRSERRHLSARPVGPVTSIG